MSTLSKFRESEAFQLEMSLSTGKSVAYLKRQINNDAIGGRKPHGNLPSQDHSCCTSSA